VTEHRPGGSPDTTVPSLFSFIVLRPERFGALVFNPYLGLEGELDPVEYFIARLCNGDTTCGQIEDAVRRRFALSPAQGRRKIDGTMMKLSRLYGLGFAPGEHRGRAHLPDTPVFPDAAPSLSAPRNVIWDITYACNLSCPHCLTDSGATPGNELDTLQALSIIDTLAEAKVFSISFSGGEPFLRPDILTLLRHAADRNLGMDIASNGQAIPSPVLTGMRELPIVHIQISIDGIGQAHDRFRGRNGAFEAACATIRRLHDEGIATSISTTVTAKNVSIVDKLIDLAVELGCRGYKAIPFLPAGRGSRHATRLKLDRTMHHQLFATLARRKKELEGRLLVSTETTFPETFGKNHEQVCVQASMGCRAGYDTLSIGADGTAYPCPFLHQFPLGNFLRTPFKTLWNKAPALRMLRGLTKQQLANPCKSCMHAPHVCKGGCRAAAYLESGDILSADPNCPVSPDRNNPPSKKI